MKNKSSRLLTESAIMIALATVMSIIKLADMPYGGSVTIASALPIAIIAYRHGAKTGLFAGLVFGVIQQLIGISTLSYFTSPLSIIAIILLDHVVAFAVIGLAGVFRRTFKNQSMALCAGCALVCLLRYACHVISGATVWAGLSIPTEAALIYSFIYNATYMVPEAIVLCIAAVYVGSAVDFRTDMPTRIVKKTDSRVSSPAPAMLGWIKPVCGLILSFALMFDIAKIFEKLQDADSGEFNISGIYNVNWQELAIFTAIAIIASLILLIIHRTISNKTSQEN